MTIHRDRVGRHAILERLDGPAGRELYLTEAARGEGPLVVWLRLGLDAATADAWLQAASRAALVRHPVLVGLVDSGRHDDGAFVALEGCAGRTLRDTLKRRAAWPLRSRAQCAEQLCEAIAAVHRAGMVHGDISPATVYVEAAERVRLAPPGLGEPNVSRVEASAETLRYCCPEELDGHPRDRRSDVYLLGAVVYLLVAGRDAFAGASPDAVRADVLDRTPPSLGAVDAGMAALDAVLRRAMAKAPEGRYADAGAMAADLLPALQALHAPSRPRPAGEPVRGRRRVSEEARRASEEEARRLRDRQAREANEAAPPPAPDTGEPAVSLGMAPPASRAGVDEGPAGESQPRSALAVDENVQFTVYRPKALDPGRWHPMLVFAHLAERRADAPPDEPDPVAEVASQAAALLGDVEGYRQHTEDSLQAVPREGELTFVPVADGVEFNPRSRTFAWVESVHREEFRMRATPATAGRIVHGRVTVYLGSLVLAEIGMSLRIGAPAVAAPASPDTSAAVDSARPYRRIFASYSHKDAAIVEEFSAYARAVGDRYLRDVIDLRSGERWQPALEQLIRQADVFQLFWSWHALESPFVRQEWVYALSLRRPRFVRPVYWDEPLPARGNEPPDVLRQLHFEFVRPARRQSAPAGHQAPFSPPAPPAPPTPPSRPAAPDGGGVPVALPGATAHQKPAAGAPGQGVPSRRRSMRTALPALAAVILAAVFVPWLYLRTSDRGAGSVTLPSVSAGSPAQPAPLPGDLPAGGHALPGDTPNAAAPAAASAVRSLVGRADAAWKTGDFEDALAAMDRAARLAPADSSVNDTLGRMERGARERLAAARATRGQARLPSTLAARVARHERQAAAAASAGNRVGAIRELLAAADAVRRD